MINKNGFRVRPCDKKKAIQYYESLSARYENVVSSGILRHLRNRERTTILKLCSFSSVRRKKVLDVGAGGGFYAITAKSFGHQVHITDTSPGMVEKLRSQVDYAWVEDLEESNPSDSFDLVVCSGVLEFVISPRQAFEKLARRVTASGRLVIQVPRDNLFGALYRIEKKCGGIRVNLYSRRWFEDLAPEFGLQLMEVAYPLPTNMVLAFERKRSPGSTE